tara:strand:+ start:37580 stop:38590 length:1011 start_codon:yes stop_codon:yes gene_type:complete
MQIANTNNQLRITRGSDIEFYSFLSMKSVSWRQDKDLNYYLVITFNIDTGDTPLEIKLSDVTSPGGWANTAAGIQSAIGDMSTWMTSTSSSGLLTSILASLQAGREFESRLVKDGGGNVLNEIRYMDTDTGTFTVEYRDAAGLIAPVSGGVTSFIEPTAQLQSIISELAWQNNAGTSTTPTNSLVGILADTAAIDTATAAILAKNTEIETSADAILAKNTEIETTANAIEVLNTAILADTAAIDTSTSKATNVAAMARLSGTGTTTISELVKSISIYNASATHTATVNIGGAGAVNLLPGETVNFDAGGNANTFADDYFVVSAGHASGDVLVIYTY